MLLLCFKKKHCIDGFALPGMSLEGVIWHTVFLVLMGFIYQIQIDPSTPIHNWGWNGGIKGC